MKRIFAIGVLFCVTAALAQAQEFPFTLVVLGSDSYVELRSVFSSKVMRKDPNNTPPTDMAPYRSIRVSELTARITARGRTTEYTLVCDHGRRRVCDELPAGSYAARWDGEQLLVRAPDSKKQREVTYRFAVQHQIVLDR